VYGCGEAYGHGHLAISDIDTMEHPSATWEAMQDGAVFYRRQQLYSIPGKLPDLSDHVAAGCPCGGPVALVRDNAKMVKLGRGDVMGAEMGFGRGKVMVYSAAGEGLLVLGVRTISISPPPCRLDSTCSEIVGHQNYPHRLDVY
jgi:hypothetical protein